DFEERHAEYEPRQNHEAREARAAVAELIEADEEYDEAWRDMAGRTHTALRREKAGIRRARALARVKGESA
ncbi:hypothetical protein DD607_36320, partial [Salmonella sp. 3DZ2-4SM]